MVSAFQSRCVFAAILGLFATLACGEVRPIDCPVALFALDKAQTQTDSAYFIRSLDLAESASLVDSLNAELRARAAEIELEFEPTGAKRSAENILEAGTANGPRVRSAIGRADRLQEAIDDVRRRTYVFEIQGNESIRAHLAEVDAKLNSLFAAQKREGERSQMRIGANALVAFTGLVGGTAAGVAGALLHEPVALLGFIGTGAGLCALGKIYGMLQRESIPAPSESVLAVRDFLELPKNVRPEWVFGGTDYRFPRVVSADVWRTSSWRNLRPLHQDWNMDWILDLSTRGPTLTYFFTQPEAYNGIPWRMR